MKTKENVSDALIAAGQDMDAAQQRIAAARKRLAAANRKYIEYQRTHA